LALLEQPVDQRSHDNEVRQQKFGRRRIDLSSITQRRFAYVVEDTTPHNNRFISADIDFVPRTPRACSKYRLLDRRSTRDCIQTPQRHNCRRPGGWDDRPPIFPRCVRRTPALIGQFTEAVPRKPMQTCSFRVSLSSFNEAFFHRGKHFCDSACCMRL